jgi:hypothetical protein
LLRALPRSYQVTPDIPGPATSDTAKASQTPAGRQRERESARRRSGTISTASDITDTAASQQQAQSSTGRIPRRPCRNGLAVASGELALSVPKAVNHDEMGGRRAVRRPVKAPVAAAGDAHARGAYARSATFDRWLSPTAITNGFLMRNRRRRKSWPAGPAPAPLGLSEAQAADIDAAGLLRDAERYPALLESLVNSPRTVSVRARCC